LASELRWILAALSVLLLIGIWFWGSRRSRQAPGNAELRETTLGSPAGVHHIAIAGEEGERVELAAGPRERAAPVLEPLKIRAADFEPVEVEPLSITVEAGPAARPADVTAPLAPRPAAPRDPQAAPARPAGPGAASARLPERAAAPAHPAGRPTPAPPAPAAPAVADTAATGTHAEAANAAQTQRIITIRVGATGDQRWPGAALLAALESHGMAFGRYQVFHRRHSDGRTVFCAASLVEPGTFDLAQMPRQEFRGVTLFAVLPGPIAPLRTLNDLIAAAGQLADTLHGTVQDSSGRALTQRQAEAIREDVAQFQAMLTGS